MNKVYFSCLWNVPQTDIKEQLISVATSLQGTCYKIKQNDILPVSFENIENRRKFNKQVQKIRGELDITINTCETKSVESYFGDNVKFEIIT